MGHAHDRFVEPGLDGLVQDGVEDDDRRLRTFEPEPLLADVAGVQEALEDLGRVQPVEDVPLLVRTRRRRHPFHVLLDPALLVRVLDVHVLDAQGAAVGIAQDREDLVESGQLLAAQAIGHKVPGKVPDGEAVVERVELGMEIGRLGIERVEVGDQVPPDPVHVDQGLDVVLLDEAFVAAIGVRRGRVVVLLPCHRLVGDLHGVEDLGVEVVSAHQTLRHVRQEQSGLRPLDDAVVVRRRDRHGLAHTEFGQHPRVGRLEARGDAEGSHADDEALTGHEPGHRLHGPDGAGVRQRDGRASEVVGTDLVGVDLSNEVFIGTHEALEVPGVGICDARDEQRAAPRLLDVDGQTEADTIVPQHPGRALAVRVGHERCVHGRHRGQPLDHRVADQVGEADLAAGGASELVVHDGAVDLEQLRRHHPDARGRGDPERGLHVDDDARRRTS